VEKFNRGYIKHNGEPAENVVDHGQSVAVMKLGTIGVNVKIIPPNARLPDDFRVREDVDTSGFAPEDVVEEEGVEELLEEPDEADADEAAADEDTEAFEEVEPPGGAGVEEELDEIEEAVGDVDDEPADGADDDEPGAPDEAELEAELDEDTEAEAEELMARMDAADEEGDD
jgi:small subunit ribosomal protein S3